MNDNTVCGYKNYVTFSVALQWDNERDLYDKQKKLLQYAINAASHGYNPVDYLAKLVKSDTPFYYNVYFRGDDFSYEDFNNVDWLEVAESMLADWMLNKGDNTAIGLSE